MRVLTYVNGNLTVIREDEFFSGVLSKPTFIQGDSFYYEPTLKSVDGRALSASEISNAEAFIDSFIFTQETIVPQVFCVNADGEYLGFKVLEEGEIQVPSKRPTEDVFVIWDFETSSWEAMVCVDKDTGVYLGQWFKASFENSTYVRKELLMPICTDCQYYDFVTKTFKIDFNKAKFKKQLEIDNSMSETIKEVTGEMGHGEVSSFTIQENEARAWLSDNSFATPLIDAILVGRNLGETKAELVAKITAKADAYKVFYGQQLGKFHTTQKALEAASTVEELKAIVW